MSGDQDMQEIARTYVPYQEEQPDKERDIDMVSNNGSDDGDEELFKEQSSFNQPSMKSSLIVRSKNKSLKNLKECEEKCIDPENKVEEQKYSSREGHRDGYDGASNEEEKIDPVQKKKNIGKVAELTNVIKQLIEKLSNFTSMYVGTKFFYEQYDTVMEMLNRFIYNENQSMILMSRSNTVLHQFISKIRNDLNKKLKDEAVKCDVRTIRINSILTTKETAILNHFAECLGMDNCDKQTLAQEMRERMEAFFKDCPGIAVLFILENVEYYVENSKQSLLYKILDMLQYTKIKFAFIATSQRVDIIDSFEKRIKSRFSHRQILFYSEDLKTFKD